MAISKKKARRITVNDVAYSWIARGQDGFIALTILPASLTGPPIWATFSYHETWIPRGGGRYTSAGDQIVITNRIVRRVILHAIEQFAYNPARKGTEVRIVDIDQQIQIADAIRACKGRWA